MSVPDDTQIVEISGFRLLCGAQFLDARNAAANEIMRRHRSGEIKETWDNTFYFPHPADVDLGESLKGTERLPDLGPGVPIASWVVALFAGLLPDTSPSNRRLSRTAVVIRSISMCFGVTSQWAGCNCRAE